MTLRARMSAIVASAVAVAVVAVAISAWWLTRSALFNEVDRQLMESAGGAAVVEDAQFDVAAEQSNNKDEREGDAQAAEAVMMVQAVPMVSMVISPDGTVAERFPRRQETAEVPIVPASQALVAEGNADIADVEPELSTYTDPESDSAYRVISIPMDDGSVNQVSRSLEDVTDTLDRLGLLLTAGAVGGVIIAGVAGWWVSRSGLRPVDRLTQTAEQVADSKDLSHRIPVDGRDEIARLGKSINKMLEELDATRTQQRQLVEDAGHELRTPLATLRTDVGLLLRAEGADRDLDVADRKELLTSVEAELAALSGLVTEVVELGRGDVDDEPIADVDVREVIDNAVERTRRVNTSVGVRAYGDSVYASLRPATVERAVANLIRNALQVTPDGSNVEIELADGDDEVVVVVADEGPGIAHDDLPRIFDRFYRGHDSRERQGSGLGLAIVRQAVEQHGGTVTAGNRWGAGARLTMRLPKSPPSRGRVSGNS